MKSSTVQMQKGEITNTKKERFTSKTDKGDNILGPPHMQS